MWVCSLLEGRTWNVTGRADASAYLPQKDLKVQGLPATDCKAYTQSATRRRIAQSTQEANHAHRHRSTGLAAVAMTIIQTLTAVSVRTCFSEEAEGASVPEAPLSVWATTNRIHLV